MEHSFRSLRVFNRLLRKTDICICKRFKAVSSRAIKEDTNHDLINAFNRDIAAGGAVPVFRRALLFSSRVAVHDEVGVHSYASLHQAAASLSRDIAAELLGETDRPIAYLCNNDASHVVVQWAIWMTGNIAVPLTSMHPPEMLKYFITDSDSQLIVCTEEYEALLEPLSKDLKVALLVHGKEKEENPLLENIYEKNGDGLTDVGKTNMWYGEADAMLIYTSGTTNKPKGVVWTHSALSAQVAALQQAWKYRAADVVLHFLPLHHIHGQLNSLNASLAAGARLRMLTQFSPHATWSKLLSTERDEARVSVIHAVPTSYARLVASYDKMFPDAKTKSYVRATLGKSLRLAVAGSAALPDRLFRKWEEISGTPLLERYGMSEVGMALSNPYSPSSARTVGSVGSPLPGVAARVAKVASDGKLKPLVTVTCDEPDLLISLERLGISEANPPSEPAEEWKTPRVTAHEVSEDGSYQGELLLKGPGVFTRYWNREPKLDETDFTSDDWFRTGDTALFADGRFKILGRTSVDIIKYSGYKISALQVESAILEHPSVSDAAVIGVPHEDCGEIVAAVVVLKEDASLTLGQLRVETGKKLAPYQLPKTVKIVGEMPRNIMGKLDKKEIRRLYEEDLRVKKK